MTRGRRLATIGAAAIAVALTVAFAAGVLPRSDRSRAEAAARALESALYVGRTETFSSDGPIPWDRVLDVSKELSDDVRSACRELAACGAPGETEFERIYAGLPAESRVNLASELAAFRPAFVARFVERHLSEGDSHAKRNMLSAAGAHRVSDIKDDVLIAALRDAEPGVRQSAAEAARWSRSEEVWRELAEVAFRDLDAATRSYVEFLITRRD